MAKGDPRRESGGARGFDAGKKIKGRKRHIVTDTHGHLVGLVVHPADVQDRDGGSLALASIRFLYPWLRHAARGAQAHRAMSYPVAGSSSDIRLARSLSQARERFRGHHRKRRRLGLRRPYPHPHAQARKASISRRSF
jgi:Transposase DDE domain